jgi:hypothetical protein
VPPVVALELWKKDRADVMLHAMERRRGHVSCAALSTSA